jgi:hypothetical protein
MSKRFAYLTAIYLIMVGYYLSFSKYGFNVWDEGGFANGSLRTMKGELAGRDFNPIGYMPGRYELGAFLYNVFGVHLQSLRIGVALLTPAMILALYASALRVMPPGFAFLASACLFVAPSMYYNRFFTLFAVLNMFCLILFIESRKASTLLMLVVAFLASAYFKFEVALFSASITIFVLAIFYFERWREGNTSLQELKIPLRQRSSVFWMIVLGMGSLISMLLYHVYSIDLYGKGVKQVLDSYAVWGNPFPEVLPLEKVYRAIGGHRYFMRLLFYIPSTLYALTGVLLVLRFVNKQRKRDMEDYYLLIVLAFGVCSFGLVLWRAGEDNLMRTLACSYILLGYFLYLFWKRVVHSQISATGRIAMNLLVTLLPFLYVYEMNTHHGFYVGSIGAMKQETERVQIDRMDIYTNKDEAQWIPEVVDRIKKYSRPGEPVLALPLNPIFYFLSNRINPTAYDWVLPGMLNEKEENDVVDALRRNRPKVVVYVDIPIDGKEERRFLNYAPHIFQYLTENYSFKEQVGIFQILLPRGKF